MAYDEGLAQRVREVADEAHETLAHEAGMVVIIVEGPALDVNQHLNALS